MEVNYLISDLRRPDNVLYGMLMYSTAKANAVVDAINAAEANRAIAVVGDILDDKYIQTLVDEAAEFGGGKIHVIVNNAGFTWDGVIHKVGSCVLFLEIPGV